MKLTYKDSTEKHKVREFIFSLLLQGQFNKVVGLGGPDVNDYVNFFHSRGIKEIEIWENTPQVSLHQLVNINKGKDICLNYGDIINAQENQEGVVYDLDYCASVRHLSSHIKKFKHNFVMTFSTRIGLKETIDTFFNSLEAKIHSEKQYSSPLEHTIYNTNKGKYAFIKYRDTSAMCCFASLNN